MTRQLTYTSTPNRTSQTRNRDLLWTRSLSLYDSHKLYTFRFSSDPTMTCFSMYLLLTLELLLCRQPTLYGKARCTWHQHLWLMSLSCSQRVKGLLQRWKQISDTSWGKICEKIVSSTASDANRLACVSCKVVRLTNDDGGDNACWKSWNVQKHMK